MPSTARNAATISSACSPLMAEQVTSIVIRS